MPPTGVTPTLRDLAECVTFSPSDGRIWLNEQRMLLLHSSTMSALRRELLEGVGAQATRGLLTRTGYSSGAQDARAVLRSWPNADPMAALTAGMRLHALEGVVKVEAVRVDYDLARQHYSGEFVWHHSSECEEHTRAVGMSSEPVCWMQLGYAMGYVSTILRRLVIFREVACRSMGHRQCRVVGGTPEQWENPEEDLRYLQLAPTPPEVATVWEPEPAAAPFSLAAPGELTGRSAEFQRLTALVERVAPTEATVLLWGESGVGKEMFARLVHRQSRRSHRALVAVNCAAIPENLVESELFGVDRGAFTGATHSRAGRFERAHQGTLMLDEVSALSLPAQAKLLRVLQSQELERVGGTQLIPINVRVIAASNVDLSEAVRRGEFRADLLYRLNVFPIHIPPLRERPDDIAPLLDHFLSLYSQRHERKLAGFTRRATQALLHYDYPGNVRELSNLVERAVIMAPEGHAVDVAQVFGAAADPMLHALRLDVQGGSAKLRGGRAPEVPEAEASRVEGDSGASSLLDHLEAFPEGDSREPLTLPALERRLLQEALDSCHGNVAAAARRLGITRAQMAYRLKSIGSPA